MSISWSTFLTFFVPIVVIYYGCAYLYYKRRISQETKGNKSDVSRVTNEDLNVALDLNINPTNIDYNSFNSKDNIDDLFKSKLEEFYSDSKENQEYDIVKETNENTLVENSLINEDVEIDNIEEDINDDSQTIHGFINQEIGTDNVEEDIIEEDINDNSQTTHGFINKNIEIDNIEEMNDTDVSFLLRGAEKNYNGLTIEETIKQVKSGGISSIKEEEF